MSKLTKKAIVESFVSLVSRKPLDKVTVKDIVEDCGITRNTFYYYFSDIYDIVDELLGGLEGDYDANHTGGWEKGFRKAMRFALDNRRAVYNMYNSSRKNELMVCINNAITRLIERLIDENPDSKGISKKDKKLIVLFYRGAVVAYIVEWFDTGMKDSADEMIERVLFLFEGSMDESVKRAVNDPRCKNKLT